LPDAPVILTVDPILIRHALFNLLMNAAQASAPDSPITLTLAEQANHETGAPGWTLNVIDHGRGVAADVLQKIFTPFFTTRKDGTGLGLTVVQHVALLHGGVVTVQSQVGRGTEVAIWLPETPTMTSPAVASTLLTASNPHVA